MLSGIEIIDNISEVSNGSSAYVNEKIPGRHYTYGFEHAGDGWNRSIDKHFQKISIRENSRTYYKIAYSKL